VDGRFQIQLEEDGDDSIEHGVRKDRSGLWTT